LRLRLLLLIAVYAFAALPAVAHAETFTINAAASFSNATPAGLSPTPVACGAPTQPTCASQGYPVPPPVQVRWGNPVGGTAATQSGLGFTAAAAGPSVVGTPFLLGSLVHFNNPVAGGTSPTGVTMTIDVTASNASGTVFSTSVPWSLVVDDTPNAGAAGDCPYPSVTPCSDAITFAPPPPVAIPASGGRLFVLNFVGFRETASSSSPILSRFISEENGTRTGYLFASIADNTVQAAARNDAYEILSGPLSVNAANGVIANDTGVSTVTVAAPPAHGTVALAANGSFTYTPAAGFHGIDTFQYLGRSSTGFLSLAVVSIAVGDFVDPTLTVPADITLEATSPSGNAVTYAATATDNVPGVTVACSPTSGSTFAIATTTVTCTATDAAGNHTTRTFTVKVQDTAAPSWAAEPADVTREATSPAGAVGGWSLPAATDVADTAVAVTCDRAPGDTFPLGGTTVTCSATDDSGNATLTDFVVTVQDTTDPTWDAQPADITREATSASGATVSWADPAASDVADAAVAVTCDRAPGDTFPLGSTVVTCTAVDDSGNDSTTSFVVRVGDTTAPVVTAPADVALEATSPSGAAATYGATAADAVDGALAAACVPASGSTFALGTHTVTCSANDAAGNSGSASFTVTVRDTTAPTWNGVAADIVREATSSAGAPVGFTKPGASDVADASVAVACDRLTGSTFALGATTVTCTATDDSGNTATTSFLVTVRDTTAPAITVPGTITGDATSPAGRTVTYSASATDAVSGAVTPSCSPASGGTFAIGTTTVTCTAVDAAGNSSSRSFSVVVRNAAQQIASLCAYIDANDLGPGNSLNAKCRGIQSNIAAGDAGGSCSKLQSFLNEVAAQRGKKLTVAEAARLTADANRLRAVLGC
jgi:hypothetical protein